MGDKNKSRGRKRKQKRRIKNGQFRPVPRREALPVCEQGSASGRKLSKDSVHLPCLDGRRMVKEGFVLFDLKNLCQFLEENFLCPECKQNTISCGINLDKKLGFCNTLEMECSSCYFKKDLDSSRCVDNELSGKPMKEINIRMVSFIRSIGRGHSALDNFSLFVNSPPPMTKKNYKKVFKRVACATKVVAFDSMRRAATEFKELSESTDCAVSLDGSWQRRGHASHHGVVSCILVETGKCIDIEVLSNICKGCSNWESRDKTSQDYLRWRENHKCKMNHSGTSTSMEPVGVVRIFERSVHTHGLQYTKFLGDGDSSSFKRVVDHKPYGEEVDIHKLECVGHVQKRCGTRLRRLKQENRGLKLGDGKGLSGAGRLTDKVIDTLQNYYGFAIRQNAGKLDAMEQSVKAVLPHVASSEENPMHDNCPDGEGSWCRYKRDPESYKHRKGLPIDIVEFIKPVFDDLSSRKLLEKCVHGKTQNNNECLNKLIWDRCSKEYFVGVETVEEACFSAVSHFNDGRKSILNLFESLHIDPGRFTREQSSNQDSSRLRSSARKSKDNHKTRRKVLRAKRKGFQDKRKAVEGNEYEPGGH